MVSVLKVCALNTAVQTLRVLFAPAGTGQASTLIAVRKSGPCLTRPGEYDAWFHGRKSQISLHKGLGSAGGRFAYRPEDTGRPQSLAPPQSRGEVS